MNANCASYPKFSLGLGFKNPTREDSYLKLATPSLGVGVGGDCQDILTKFGLKIVKLGIFPKLRIKDFCESVDGLEVRLDKDLGNFMDFFLKWSTLVNFGCKN
jgi:hypothetical protein